MNMLTLLRDEMRALGIKSLTIELEPRGLLAYELPVDDRPTDTPSPLNLNEVRPEKGPGVCAAPGCTAANGGVFGAATEYCERHALAEAGVR